jgi:hypothetical protein
MNYSLIVDSNFKDYINTSYPGRVNKKTYENLLFFRSWLLDFLNNNLRKKLWTPSPPPLGEGRG